MSSPKASPIASLPNELLSGILSSLTTLELLPLASISNRLHLVVADILYRRISDVASLPDNSLILESYLPSAKLTTPSLSCQFQEQRPADGSEAYLKMRPLAGLRQLYSCFRPVVIEENRRRPRRWLPIPLDGIIINEGPDSQEQLQEQSMPQGQRNDTATQDVFLDEDIRFEQLCVSVGMRTAGARPDIIVSHIDVIDGVVRVFRNWLAEMSQKQSSSTEDMSRILWVDSAENVGLKFSVRTAASERMPLISGPDEEPPVLYTLVYEELLVRTSKLLLAAERSRTEDMNHSGKAIIVAAM